MKNVLLATTALVAFAGAAAAEVSLSGSAEMGISGGDGLETLFHQSVDITFTMTGETDTGLSFGATIDLEDALDAAAAGLDTTDDRGNFADYTVFIKGAFGTLTLGDTDGALAWALASAAIGNPGSLGDDETVHAGFLDSYADGAYNGQILRYEYAFGDFGVAVSAELDETGVSDAGYALGFTYGLSLGSTTVNFGLGYQSATVDAGFLPGNLNGALIGAFAGGEEIGILGASVSAELAGGFSAALEYSKWDNDTAPDFTHVGVGIGYTTGPISLAANYGMFDGDAGAWDVQGYGLTAAYDLGGGLTVNAGYGHSEYFGADAGDTWSLGLKMAF